MIRYALKCIDDHSFESWFASSGAYDTLSRSRQITCPICGADKVSKAIMAPPVRASGKAAPDAAEPENAPPEKSKTPLQTPATEAERALSALRRKVEATSDYVGLSFAAEARKMHDGDIPHRSIYGEANAVEAKKLLQDGIPVAPLPFIPQRKTN